MGLGLPEFLAMQARGKSASESSAEASAKQVLVVYEEGGISQMEFSSTGTTTRESTITVPAAVRRATATRSATDFPTQ